MEVNQEISEIYSRNELYWGKEAQKLLFSKKVLIAGLGGVGAYAAEALARSGVGNLVLLDFDKVTLSNINRQLLALHKDIGRYKTELMKERIEQINPHIHVEIITDFYTESIKDKLFSTNPDFIIDAIDILMAKCDIIENSIKRNIPIISSIGAGNRIDPEQLCIKDLSEIKTHKCPFIKNVAYRLRNRGITEGITIVTSTEKPQNLEKREHEEVVTTNDGRKIDIKKFTPASTPFVSPVAGYMMASYVVREFLKEFYS
ncbi:MAG: tRNA threonylcarbamoyladenosine dehydratase [Candidatus Gastranaerophilales bacterium]|nr:tRNA threonylcarbamoyladenosine dehydratase [Candidatus Gastranaerophilales bacterium]